MKLAKLAPFLPALTSAALSYTGTCPEVTGTPDFNPDLYQGTWFNLAISPFFWDFPTARCTSATYKTNTDEDSIADLDVINSSILAFGFRSTFRGKAIIENGTPPDDKLATLSVSFFKDPVPNTDNYIVFSTDNISYSYVWSCKNNEEDNEFEPVLYILNRSSEVSAWKTGEHIKNAMLLLDNYFGFGGDNASDFEYRIRMVNMDDCPDPGF